MKIFRYKRNGGLYTIERVSPMRVLGSHYECIPYKHDLTTVLMPNTLKDFELVAEGNFEG